MAPLVAVLMLASACSAAQTSSDKPTPEPTPDIEALGEYYLAASEPFNLAACQFNKVWVDSQATPQQRRDAAAALAVAFRSLSDSLRAQQWPPPLDSDVRALLSALADAEADLQAAATATDYDNVVSQMDSFFEAGDARAAAAIRVRGDLGLPASEVGSIRTDC
jgi:hypothetical protein